MSKEILINGIPLTAADLKRLRVIAWVFVAIGALSIIWPVVATIAVSQLIAWLLVFSGISGIVMWARLRGHSGGLIALGTAVMGLALGTIFLFYPFVGAGTLTMMLAVLFLLEAAGSFAIGFALRGKVAGWGWIVASGATALLMAILIFSGWPGTATWLLGLLFGLNLLSTGISMLMLSRAV